MAEDKEGQTESEQTETNQGQQPAKISRRGFLGLLGIFAGGVAAGVGGVKLAESDKGKELTQKLGEGAQNLAQNVGDKVDKILEKNDIAGKMSEEPAEQMRNRPPKETIIRK